MNETATPSHGSPSGAPPRGGIARRLLQELLQLGDSLTAAVPGRVGQHARHFWLSRRLKRLGRMGAIEPFVEFRSPENIVIGDEFMVLRNASICADDGGLVEIGRDVSMGANASVDAGSGGVIRIGDHSGVATNSVLRSSSHEYSDPTRPWKAQGHRPGSIILEEDVWVAANCVLLPGTYLEKGVVVASGSVVGGRVKAFSVVAGNPARVIGKRG